MKAPTDEAAYSGYRLDFIIQWRSWAVTETEEMVPLPANYEDALQRWFYSGVTESVVETAVEIAMTSGPRVPVDDKFKYLCGVIKRMSAGVTDVMRVDPLKGMR